MSLSDIFSIPFLICLSICILLIGCSSIYFYQKISQQDHKISSMIGLISTMAEENQSFRMNLVSVAPSQMGGCLRVPPVEQLSENRLIEVSDDEDSGSESDSEESEMESDNETESGEDSDDEQDESHNETHHIKISLESLNLESLHENEKDEDELPDLEEIESDSESSEDMLDLDEDIHDITITNHDEMISIEELEQEPIPSNNIKSIHLDLEESENKEPINISLFKTINLPNLEDSTVSGKVIETADYKKMSITKLREVISKRGVTDASKLKKNEILKMLGVDV